MAITNVASGKQVAVEVADGHGRISSSLVSGAHAFAITASRGFSWIESELAPNPDKKLVLSRECHRVSGKAPKVDGARVLLMRMSESIGDTFVAEVAEDGTFEACLPAGSYGVSLGGSVLSVAVGLAVPAEKPLILSGVPKDVVEQAPRTVAPVVSTLEAIVSDIVARDARIIGLGEATHGTAELVSARAALTLELVRHAELRLVLFEGDAMLGAALDEYVTGGSVDIGAAVAALGFWITDTVEFLQFLKSLRDYNSTVSDKVRVWGVDIQNTHAPSGVLREAAARLELSDDDLSMLSLVAEQRAASIRTVDAARRATFEATLKRLGGRRNDTFEDLRIAVAARSLLVQMSYQDGDFISMYSVRRDVGMARMASFLVEQTGARRACFWAHAGHIAREPSAGQRSTGDELATLFASRYYPVGFYVEKGIVRAWDAAFSIGVIPHVMPEAPAFSVESAVMRAAKSSEIAWLPLGRATPALRSWLEVPRFVREVGSVFIEGDMMTLRNIPVAFDAVVVLRDSHGSTPTPTGIRVAKP